MMYHTFLAHKSNFGELICFTTFRARLWSCSTWNTGFTSRVRCPAAPAPWTKNKSWSSWFAWDWHARNLNITRAYTSLKRSYHFALKTWSWLSIHELIISISFKASTALLSQPPHLASWFVSITYFSTPGGSRSDAVEPYGSSCER